MGPHSQETFVKFVVNSVAMLDVPSGGPGEEVSEEDEPVGWR